MKIRQFSLSLIITLIVTSQGFSGAWPRLKGKFYSKLYYSTVSANQYFNQDGETVDLSKKLDFSSFGLYGEYGLNNKLTSIINVPVSNAINYGNRSFSSIGDAYIGLKYCLSNGSLISSFNFYQQLGISNLPNDAILNVSDKQWSQVYQLELSKSVSNHLYLSTYIGYRDRKNGFNDEIKAGIEGGYSFFDSKLYLIVRSDLVLSKNNEIQNYDTDGNLYGNGVSYLSFSPEINYQITQHIGINARMGTAFFAKNIYANPILSFGVSFSN